MWPDGQIAKVPQSGVVINARLQEMHTGTHPSGAELVRMMPIGTPEDDIKLQALEERFPGAVVIGSLLAAQAYPGRIVAMTPSKNPSCKRADRFTTFAQETK
jgi:hypothetical protein